ncbi:MAG: hypothetical protein J5645_00595 [Lachnospiraceae bacterium]|nr:hypothetical protein [Lachnospiraceae bacterium]
MDIIKVCQNLAKDEEVRVEIASILCRAIKNKPGANGGILGERVGVTRVSINYWIKKSPHITPDNFVGLLNVCEKDYPTILEECTSEIREIIDKKRMEVTAQKEEIDELVFEGEERDDLLQKDSSSIAIWEALTLRMETEKKLLESIKKEKQLEKELHSEREKTEFWQNRYNEKNSEWLEECRQTQILKDDNSEMFFELKGEKNKNEALVESQNEMLSELRDEKQKNEAFVESQSQREQIDGKDRRLRSIFLPLGFVAIVCCFVPCCVPSFMVDKTVAVISFLEVLLAVFVFAYIGIVDPNGWGDVDNFITRFIAKEKGIEE